MVIDLKYNRAVRNIVIWQSFNAHFNMQNAKIKLSSNGNDWKSMGSSAMSNSHTGALGASFDLPAGTAARYVRVEVSNQMGYYYGIGEIEVFEKPRHAPPKLSVVQVNKADSIKLDWAAPGSDQVVVLRKKWKDAGQKSRFSHSRHDGIVVLKTGKPSGSIVDKDPQNGNLYYYTVCETHPADISQLYTTNCSVSEIFATIAYTKSR